jgi:Leucine-rich repeat (LRR) protein
MDDKELLKIIDKAGEEGAGHLDLSGKQLTTLPKEIGRLRNLRVLDLDGNQLTVLPLELFELTNLTHLRLSDNHLASLPPEIGQLANLQVLYAYKNKLKTIPAEIGQLDQLDQLVVPFNEISALPKEISQLNRLLYLSVYFNSLSDFILEITRLVNLRTLEIHGNRITKLPGEFAELVNLEDLTIGSNQLTSLPKEILKLTKLKRLKIYQMSLSSCPPEIFQLSNLENLDVSYNKLTSLGPEINRLSGLEVLQLQSNNFSVFPSEILGFTNLKILDLSKNPMTALPSELGRLAHLETLKLDNTPISSPPPEIVEQGTQAILLYLREQLQGGRKQWVSKLLVVGEGGVGKTSLLRALRGEPFQTEESTTHGIDIQPLMLSHPDIDKVSMQLNTWDFGGQDIYHATHQFFLTNRSLFVLAWNARLGFEQGKLYYWLDTIKARAPESPVLIVATYIDEREANIPLAELQRKYPQVIGHCEISSKTGAGIENLKAAITNAAATLPLMGEVWPANWLNAANAIRSSQENHITPKQLYDLMAEHNVERDKVPILAQWLHELGDLLYFKDDDELNDIVILNPQWVTQSISRVLESEDIINNLGLFAREHMNALWSDIDPPMREHFLRLMEKFDLSYRTLENKDISLVVERLSFEPPKYEDTWEAVKHSGNCNEISMKFELDTTMPAGVPTWFIARTHRFTTRNHWRYGALFADGPEQKHLGLIQAFPHDRFIKLTARGSIPHSFFALLVDGLEVTLRRFPGLRINRKIPCPGHEGEACTHEFELTNLQRAIERKPPVLEIQCPVSFENVPVPGLLFGLP